MDDAGGKRLLIRATASLLPVPGSYTRFALPLSPAELAPYDGRFLRVRLKKTNSNTTHRIAVDDFSLTRETPFGSGSDKTPIPVPVPKPQAEIRRLPGGLEIVFRGLEPDATWQFEEAADLAGPWPPGALFTGADTWTLTRPLAGPRRFFRAAGPARIGRPALPPP